MVGLVIGVVVVVFFVFIICVVVVFVLGIENFKKFIIFDKKIMFYMFVFFDKEDVLVGCCFFGVGGNGKVY